MGFILSKLFWTFTQPASLLFFAVFGAWALQSWLPRLSRWLLAGAALFLAVLSLTPAGHYGLATLEERFPAIQPPPAVDGIVVLGGELWPEASAMLGRTALGEGAERLTEFMALARRYPQAKLVYSGGSGNWRNPEAREADQAAPFFASLGLDTRRILLERDSRNTWENAVYSLRLVKPEENQTWLLITSASHMPRAVGCFRAAGWKVVPYPVDFHPWPRDQWPWLETLSQLAQLSAAAREWVGLVGYHLMGRTDAWFPGPVRENE